MKTTDGKKVTVKPREGVDQPPLFKKIPWWTGQRFVIAWRLVCNEYWVTETAYVF